MVAFAAMLPDALLSQPTSAMATNASPSFEVATIKPSPPSARGSGSGMDPGGRFTERNLSLRDLILLGYGLHPRQIAGGPGWLETEKFDIVASADTPGAPSKAQVMTMLQKLLADRFALRFHREKKELSVYAITVGKPGPKLTPNTADPNGLPTARMDGLGRFTATNMTMGEFAEGLQGNVLDRPVVDETALQGRFDFTLNWTPDEFQFPGLGVRAAPPDTGGTLPDLFTAFKDQLGLKLEPTKSTVEILVMDQVERPSGN